MPLMLFLFLILPPALLLESGSQEHAQLFESWPYLQKSLFLSLHDIGIVVER